MDAPETTNGSKRATLADLQKSREVEALTPTGLNVLLRPINLERHALQGGLPKKLVTLAAKGADGINEVLSADDDSEEAAGEKAEVLAYLDNIVRDLFIDPKLPKAVEADLDDVLLPADYRWAIMVAMGEEDRDGMGRRLWGREPLSRWETFRDEHRCAEDCAACRRVALLFSPAVT